jgi:hypothetical protein
MLLAFDSIVETSSIAGPRIYTLKLNDQKLGHDGKPLDQKLRLKLSSWKWVKADELRECLNHILCDKGIDYQFHDVEAMLKAFVLLNIRINPPGLYTWISKMYIGLHEESLRRYDDFNDYFIPFVWSKKIVEMVEQGVLEVVRRDLAPNMPSNIVDFDAVFADGTTAWLHWEGGDRFKIVSETRKKMQ